MILSISGTISLKAQQSKVRRRITHWVCMYWIEMVAVREDLSALVLFQGLVFYDVLGLNGYGCLDSS